MPAAIQLALAVTVIAAASCDLRSRRIPNSISVSGAVAGIALNGWYGGFSGLAGSVAGGALGFAVFFVLYVAGGMGAGDVKLFAAVGALVGPSALVVVFVLTGLIGGVAGLGLALARGRLRETLDRTALLLTHFEKPGPANALRLPYGAVIAAGALLSLGIR